MNNTLVASFSNNLRDWMAAGNMSQMKVSKASGVPQPMISRIVSGQWKNLTLETVRKISSVFGVGVELKFSGPSARGNVHGVKIPDSAACFWDVSVRQVRLPEHNFFVAERILNYGSQRDVQWLFKNVGNEEIRKVVKQSRELSDKSRNFWSIMLGLE